MCREPRDRPAVNAQAASSRGRLLDRVRTGDADGAVRELERHLGTLREAGQMTGRHPVTPRALANRAWVRDTLRRKDPGFAELLDNVVLAGVSARGTALFPARVRVPAPR